MTLDVASSITLQTFKSVFRIWPFLHEFKNASDRTKKVSGAIRQGKSDNRFPHVKMGEILANG